MKNILLMIILMITMISCDNNCRKEKVKVKKITLTYIVFYPEYRDTISVSCDSFDESCGYDWGCYEGENYIDQKPGFHKIYSGSAPFKILSYTKR